MPAYYSGFFRAPVNRPFLDIRFGPALASRLAPAARGRANSPNVKTRRTDGQAKQGSHGCSGCPLSRRRFLTAASAGALGVLAPAGLFQACARTDKLRMRVVYALHAVVQPGPDWPNVGFDFQPVMDRTTATLTKAFPGWEFATAMAKGPEEAKKILADDAASPVRRLRRRPAQLLEPRRPDDRRVGQAHALRRFPIRRERRLPRLHGRVPAQEDGQRRLRRLVAARGPRRRLPRLRTGEEERDGERFRGPGRLGPEIGDAASRRPRRRGRRAWPCSRPAIA